MDKPAEDYCENCGALAAGRAQWMFSDHGIYKQFYCFRCRAWMRFYAAIAFSLLAAVLLAIVGFLWWLKVIP